jgi:hypothetical protein
MDWMSRIFAGHDYEIQASLFNVMHDFLSKEIERKKSGRVNKDIVALIGTNSDLADSG